MHFYALGRLAARTQEACFRAPKMQLQELEPKEAVCRELCSVVVAEPNAWAPCSCFLQLFWLLCVLRGCINKPPENKLLNVTVQRREGGEGSANGCRSRSGAVVGRSLRSHAGAWKDAPAGGGGTGCVARGFQLAMKT